jgi:uncharacterized protein
MPKEATGKTGVPSQRRQKPERPRDELGRPRPWEEENLLHLPDFDALTADENDRLGRELLRDRNYFGAHEAWETAWKQARGSGEEELFKGLSQMGAGYVHLLRGNVHGAITLLRRGARRVGAYPAGTRGIDTGALAARLEEDAGAVESGRLVPGPDATVDPPAV